MSDYILKLYPGVRWSSFLDLQVSMGVPYSDTPTLSLYNTVCFVQGFGDVALTPWRRGCARFAEIWSELTKTWSSGATQFWVWIGNSNVKVWKSTEDKLHKRWNSNYFCQISAKQAHPSPHSISNPWKTRPLKDTIGLVFFSVFLHIDLPQSLWTKQRLLLLHKS